MATNLPCIVLHTSLILPAFQSPIWMMGVLEVILRLWKKNIYHQHFRAIFISKKKQDENVSQQNYKQLHYCVVVKINFYHFPHKIWFKKRICLQFSVAIFPDLDTQIFFSFLPNSSLDCCTYITHLPYLVTESSTRK